MYYLTEILTLTIGLLRTQNSISNTAHSIRKSTQVHRFEKFALIKHGTQCLNPPKSIHCSFSELNIPRQQTQHEYLPKKESVLTAFCTRFLFILIFHELHAANLY